MNLTCHDGHLLCDSSTPQSLGEGKPQFDVAGLQENTYWLKQFQLILLPTIHNQNSQRFEDSLSHVSVLKWYPFFSDSSSMISDQCSLQRKELDESLTLLRQQPHQSINGFYTNTQNIGLMIKYWEFGEFSMTRYELQTNDSIYKLQRHQWSRARNDTSASTSFWSRHSCSCDLSQSGKRWNQWHHLQWLCLSHAQGIPAGRQATVTQWIEQNLPLCRGWDQQTSKYWNGKTCLHQYGRDHQS